MTVQSGAPFNITAGSDLYGTSLFNGRPGIANDASKPGLILTRYGLLDPSPTPDQQTLPRNSGRGPVSFREFSDAADSVNVGDSMKPAFRGVGLVALGVAAAFGAEKPIKMKDLPPAVQKAVQEQTKGGELKGLSKEVENGKTFYEAETRVNGRTRDILIDATGAVVEVEDEVTLDSIPAAVRNVIVKQTGEGKILKIEQVTKGNALTYEAAIEKAGKKFEIVVAADGSVQK